MKLMPSVPSRVRRLAVLAPVAVAVLSACQPYMWNSTNSATLQALNVDRNLNGLGSLPVQADSQNKAQAWAEQLARDGYLHHSTLPTGIATRWCSLGENIGYGPTIQAIETAYMNSPTHRDNILATKWNGAGVGVATGGGRVYTVQEFITTC